MKNLKKALAMLLCAAMLIACVPAALAAEPAASRGEVADALLAAADDYNSGVKRSDIIKGYPDGQLHEQDGITRAEALVMLSRAFGTLPAPVGDSARNAYSISNFTDVPKWAATELENIFAAGIVAGTSATTFSPNEPVTMEQLQLFVRRVYALEGTNLKDDFYAAVNKTELARSVIQPGYISSSTFNQLSYTVNEQLSSLIQKAADNPVTDAEKKISVLYNNVLNEKARDAEGIEPIQPYLTAINQAENLSELMDACNRIYSELGQSMLFSFGYGTDQKNSNYNILTFSGWSTTLGQSGYSGATEAQKAAYLTYVKDNLMLVGESKAEAEAHAALVWDFEAAVAAASLPRQELSDVDKTYNVFTMKELQAMVPAVDLTRLFTLTGLSQTNKIKVTDVGALKAFAGQMSNYNLDLLKTLATFRLVTNCGPALNHEFMDAANAFNYAYIGLESVPLEDVAAQYVQLLMSDYMGKAYVDTYFSAKTKSEVEAMVSDIRAVYKQRIQALTWMSSATKTKALRKLDTMTLKIGYPDTWKDPYKNAELKTFAEGGSLFDNLVAMNLASREDYIAKQKQPTNKREWIISPYTVNAYYEGTSNSINFPAAILQPPFYDSKASYEQNLGSIGYIIAHEMSHAFDTNGSKYDENGNAANWWTEEDYAAFRTLCDKVTALYDGREIIPGITCDGSLTLAENIADLGSMACLTQLVGSRSGKDYKTLYTAASKIWCSSYTRDMRAYVAQTDVHAADKLRGSLVLQQFPQFYEAFGITEGDGMWLAPEDRVTIW